MSELKPCPFCGLGIDAFDPIYDRTHRLQAVEHPLLGCFHDSLIVLITHSDQWNRRAPVRDEAPNDVKELVDELDEIARIGRLRSPSDAAPFQAAAELRRLSDAVDDLRVELDEARECIREWESSAISECEQLDEALSRAEAAEARVDQLQKALTAKRRSSGYITRRLLGLRPPVG